MSYLYTNLGLIQTDTDYDFHGWTPECPGCGSRKTRYASVDGFHNWYCTDCGLTEAPIEEWIGKPAAREIFYG